MRKMFLIVLSLVIVSMFIVGCGTGQAVKFKNVEKQTQNEVPEAKGPGCKLFSGGVDAKDAALLQGKTGTQVCNTVGMACIGVYGQHANIKEPGVADNYNSLSGGNLCNFELMHEFMWPDSTTSYTGVLCCR